MFITLAAMHFGASYHLAYGDGLRSIKHHPFGLVVFPAALAAASAFVVLSQTTGHAGAGRSGLRLLLVAVFTLTGWHYIKQAYGIAMLSARSAGLRPTRHEALLLRYALYPVWLYDVLEIYGRGRSASYQSYDVTMAIVPHGLDPWVRGGAALSLASALVLMAVLGARARRVPPLGLWGTYLAGGLWFLVPPTYVSATVVLAGLHAVQYLTVSHRAEVDLAVERREPHLLHRWLCVFGGAAAGGLLLTNWLPDLASRSATPGVPAMVPSLIFVVFNLHHYAVDAVIWRSGGEHVLRMSRGPQPAAQAEAAPVPAPAAAPAPALA
ncbi:hypothetical protein KSP35_03925 [Aquihabitans sp. G128]|uniref:hypothetical protein n=1 Tax=Aquihabitans sp. G128 TaxID=2849779 RepID=UPI001C22A51A|nr:hypothetical protein [Aquihabitans sp. G128]QXC61978.1 hypothetical protein KSP35_03925 [Aquihabitans sp. G128]